MMVLKVSESQRTSLSLKDDEGQSVRQLLPLPPPFLCEMYEATIVAPLKKNG